MREGKKQFWRKKKNTKVILTAMHQSAPVAGDDDSQQQQQQQIRVNSSFDNDIARLKPPSFEKDCGGRSRF